MTPAEHARLIDRMEFAAECKAVRKRALAYAKQRRQQERQRFIDWLQATAEEPTDWQERITANREAIKRRMAAQSKKPAKLYTYKGEAKTITEWSILTGLKHSTIAMRIRAGMDMERVLTMKPGSRAKVYTVNGISKTLQEWADHVGITRNQLNTRLKSRTLAEIVANPSDQRIGGSPRGRAPQLHTVDGISKPLREWAEDIGVTYKVLSSRLKTRTLVEALAMPAGRHPKQPLPGVHHDLEAFKGTGAGSIAQEIPEITFSKQADNA